MPATHYPAVIDRSASGFGVSFPDFPGCIAAGATINEAALNAEAALALHIEGMVKDKDPLPEPSELDFQGMLDQPNDVCGIVVRADVPVKVERVLISLDAGLLRAIDAVASNRSAWIADAARAALRGGRSNDMPPIQRAAADASQAIAEAVAKINGAKPKRAINLDN